MKRSPLKRKTPLKRTGRKLRLVSRKRAKQNKLYSEIRKVYLEENPACEVCGKQATQIHHKRGRIHDRLNDTAFFMAVCFECHHWIHHNPQIAYAKDYLVKQ